MRPGFRLINREKMAQQRLRLDAVAELMSDGFSNSAIGRHLGVSHVTIGKDVALICADLGRQAR